MKYFQLSAINMAFQLSRTFLLFVVFLNISKCEMNTRPYENVVASSFRFESPLYRDCFLEYAELDDDSPAEIALRSAHDSHQRTLFTVVHGLARSSHSAPHFNVSFRTVPHGYYIRHLNSKLVVENRASTENVATFDADATFYPLQGFENPFYFSFEAVNREEYFISFDEYGVAGLVGKPKFYEKTLNQAEHDEKIREITNFKLNASWLVHLDLIDFEQVQMDE